jgi:energy-coupling factor transporter ATP-binding protein EcfA2
MFRKPANESLSSAYEWSQRMRGESKDWMQDYYWTKPMDILCRIKLPHQEFGLLAITGLQGTGKTTGLRMMYSCMIEDDKPSAFIKWTRNWIEDFKTDDADFRDFYEEVLKKDFDLFMDVKGRAYIGKQEDLTAEYMEGKVGKGRCKDLKRDAVMEYLRSRKFVFIDLPDYTKTDVRFMATDFDEIQELWHRLLQRPDNPGDTTIVMTIQKELCQGRHFFLGKFDITELPLLTPQELMQIYKWKFKSTAPFTKETLEVLAKLARGVFRRFQRYCGLTIQAFMADDKEPPITGDYAEKAISDGVILEDMQLELYEKFPSDAQRRLAIDILRIFIKKKGLEMSQQEIAETFGTNEMAISRVVNGLVYGKYLTRERVDHSWLVKMLDDNTVTGV